MSRMFIGWYLLIVSCVSTSLPAQEIYIDQVHYLPTSSEFSIEISLLGEWDYKHFQRLENQTLPDRSKFPDPNRRHLPVKIAQEHFDLSPFRDLLLFNAEHQLICELTISEVALFTAYESYFVAIFVSKNGFFPKSAVHSDLYCISKSAEPYLTERFISRPLAATSLDDRITNWFTLSESQQPAIRHTLLYPENTVYSVLSYFEERPAHRYRTHSYLLETRKTDLSILMKVQGETEHDQIYSLQALPIQVRRRPVLLLDMGETDTDIRWCQLAVYTGSEYELIEGNWIVLR